MSQIGHDNFIKHDNRFFQLFWHGICCFDDKDDDDDVNKDMNKKKKVRGTFQISAVVKENIVFDF